MEIIIYKRDIFQPCSIAGKFPPGWNPFASVGGLSSPQFGQINLHMAWELAGHKTIQKDLHLVLFSYANLCSISFTCLSHFPSRVYHKRQIRTHHMWPRAVIFKLGVPTLAMEHRLWMEGK